MPSVSGDIRLMPIGDMIAWIANRKMTCVMSLRRGQTDTHFLIREGVVWQARSSDPREYLGQHLINFGYIDEDQLQKAFDTQNETHVPLGRVLVMVDAVSQAQLDRVLLFKTRESLLEAMCWTEGTFRVTDEIDESQDLDSETPVDLNEVHSEGMARALMWVEIRKVFPSDATRCDVRIDDESLIVSSFDRRLLDVLRAGRSIGEASLELRSMDFQIYARLYDLYNRGVIRPRLEPVTGLDVDIDVELEVDVEMDVELSEADVLDVAPSPPARDTKEGVYRMRPERPREAPGIEVPSEAADPSAALRIALAGRNWNEALLIAERILEVDPQNAEAIAARRVADVQVRRMAQVGGGTEIDIHMVPTLLVDRGTLPQAHLTSKERYVLSRIDGIRTLQQIAAVSPIQREELLRIVQGFVTRGTVSLS